MYVAHTLPKALGSAAVLAIIPGLQAATINQSTNLGGGNHWNQANYWGGNTVQTGNDYQASTGLGTSNYAFTVNGHVFDYTGEVRDAQDAGVNNTFAGDNLILPAGTRLLSKAQSASGVTSTVNITTQGGYISSSANNTGNQSTLAGTLSIMDGTQTALLLNPPGTFTWNVSSIVTGAADTTLNLVIGGNASETKHGILNFASNLDAFAGTLFVSSVSNSKSMPGNPTSALFRIANSAPLATLNLATNSTSFSFDLNSNITFGSVIVGGVALDAGVYDFDDLSALAPGKFVDNSGSITVVPEPSAALLGGWALLGWAIGFRRRSAM